MKDRYLALDLGTKTLGLAISNGIIASPYKTLYFPSEEFHKPLNLLLEIIREEQINVIVVGYPKNMNNSLGHRVAMVDDFLGLLKNELEKLDSKLEIVLIDERLTTRMANNIMLQANLSRDKRKQKKDTLAAQLILETYLTQINGKK